MRTRAKAPVWFWIVLVLVLLWDGFGFLQAVQQFRHGADAMPGATDYDRRLMASMPLWYNWLFLLATLSGVLGVLGVLGALALLLREARAVSLFWLSLIAVVVQFGYLFATSDIIAVKGAATVIPFPVVIFLVALGSLLLARLAVGRGWVGRF